jgi:hypothetical protein
MFILWYKQKPIITFTSVVEIAPIADEKPRHVPRALVGNI